MNLSSFLQRLPAARVLTKTKDTLAAAGAKDRFNQLIRPYGKVLEFQLNTRERTVFASFRLKGELEAIQFWIHQYQLVANKKGQTFIVVDVTIRELKPGDVVVLKEGDTVPADGTVISGEAKIQENLFTGFPKPARKSDGSEIYATTQLTEGNIHFRVGPGQPRAERLLELYTAAFTQPRPIRKRPASPSCW
jgi:high-affinity K+ transport system ATPase subunit B